MKRFASFVVGRRVIVVAVLVLTGLLLGLSGARIPVDMDVSGLLPSDDPDVRFFRETGRRFMTEYINMIGLEAKDLFTHDALFDLRAVTRAVKEVKGVRQVMSLTNLLDMQPDGEGAISVRRLIDANAVPSDPAELAQIRRNVLGNEMLAGNLVSPDGRAALITVMLDENVDLGPVAARIKQAAEQAAPDRTLYFGGVAMIVDFLGKVIVSPAMIGLMTLFALVYVTLLYLGLGRLRDTASVLAGTVLAILCTLGTMALLGMTLSMFTSTIPLLLLAVGPFFATVIAARRHDGDGVEAALANQAGPVLAAGLSMAALFLALWFTPLAIFRETGIGLAIGVAWSALLAVTFLPALLALLPYAAPRGFSVLGGQGKLLGGIARVAVARPGRVIALFVLTGLAAGVAAPTLSRNVNPMDNFPPGSEPRRTEALMQRSFGGSQLFQINFRSADIRHPAILERMDLLARRLRTIPDVHFPQSVADVVRMLNRNLNNEPGLPDSMEKINSLYFMLEGQSQVELLAEKTYANAVVQARIGDISAEVVARAIGQIRQAIEQTVPSHLVNVKPADLPAAARREVQKRMAHQVAAKAALDYGFRTGRDVSTKQQAQLAESLAELVIGSVALGVADRTMLAEKITANLTGDSSDVALDSGFDPGPAAASLAALESFEREQVVARLKQTLPAPAWQDDPEGLEYAAEALKAIFNKQVEQVRHRRAIDVFQKQFGIDLSKPDSVRLLADLEADLWGLNNDFIALEPGVFRQVVGAEPAAADRIEVATRLTGWPQVNTKLYEQLPGTLGRTTAAVLVLALALLIAQGRSLRAGLFSVSIALFAVLVLFGAMAVLRIPLDNMAEIAVVLAVALGTAYAMVWRGGVGRPIAIHALTTGAAFFVLCFSGMATQSQLGLFTALAAGSAGLAAIAWRMALKQVFGSRGLINGKDGARKA